MYLQLDNGGKSLSHTGYVKYESQYSTTNQTHEKISEFLCRDSILNNRYLKFPKLAINFKQFSLDLITHFVHELATIKFKNNACRNTKIEMKLNEKYFKQLKNEICSTSSLMNLCFDELNNTISILGVCEFREDKNSKNDMYSTNTCYCWFSDFREIEEKYKQKEKVSV